MYFKHEMIYNKAFAKKALYLSLILPEAVPFPPSNFNTLIMLVQKKKKNNIKIKIKKARTNTQNMSAHLNKFI